MGREKMPEASPESNVESVTVAVIAMCGAKRLNLCLDALARQLDAPPFELIVVYDPRLTGIESVGEQHPGARVIRNSGQHTPLQLVPKALTEARGEIILLTKDHCAPDSNWVHAHVAAQREHGRGAVGGVMRPSQETGALGWAVFFLDFFRYVEPRTAGPADALTVCNVSYRKSQLDAVRPIWETIFHETAVNRALRERFGPLWLESRAAVTMGRRVAFRDIARERYAFGRSFGATRLEYSSGLQRIVFILLSPMVPLVVMGRMLAVVMRNPRYLAAFCKSLAYLVILLCGWTLGEWLGYVTHRRSRAFGLAPEAE